MSSQGLNATTYSGFVLSSAGTGVDGSPPGFPMRDAQDFTLFKKRRGMSGTVIPNGIVASSKFYSVLQSNENRLSAQFGLIGCDCSDGFPHAPLNGVAGS